MFAPGDDGTTLGTVCMAGGEAWECFSGGVVDIEHPSASAASAISGASGAAVRLTFMLAALNRHSLLVDLIRASPELS